MTSGRQADHLRRLARLIALPRPAGPCPPGGPENGAPGNGASARATARIETQRALVGRLGRALDGELRRGRAGHWSFDANRCLALEQALAEARRGLLRLEQQATANDGSANRHEKGRGA